MCMDYLGAIRPELPRHCPDRVRTEAPLLEKRDHRNTRIARLRREFAGLEYRVNGGKVPRFTMRGGQIEGHYFQPSNL
jgi:hypothetical protein